MFATTTTKGTTSTTTFSLTINSKNTTESDKVAFLPTFNSSIESDDIADNKKPEDAVIIDLDVIETDFIENQHQHHQQIIKGGFWPNWPSSSSSSPSTDHFYHSYFQRLDLENKLKHAITTLCTATALPETLIVYGESGVGKSTLVSHVLSQQDDNIRNVSYYFLPHDLYAILWLNIDNNNNIFDQVAFYLSLVELLHSIGLIDRCDVEPNQPSLQHCLNSITATQQNGKLLLVLDNITNYNTIVDIVKSLSRLNSSLSSQLCCIALLTTSSSFDTTSAVISKQQSLFKVDKMSLDQLQSMLGEHYSIFKDADNNNNNNNKLKCLAETCHGLPLIASLLIGSDDSRMMVASLLLSSATEKLQQQVDALLPYLLGLLPIFQQTSMLENFYTFLLFQPGTVVDLQDLSVLWNNNNDDLMIVAETCQKAVDACLLQPMNSSRTSYAVHELVFNAIAEQAAKQFGLMTTKNHVILAELRRIILSKCCRCCENAIDNNNNSITKKSRCSLIMAITGRRKKLLRLLIESVDPQLLANMALEWDTAITGATALHLLAEIALSPPSPSSWLSRDLAIELFCRLADTAARYDFDRTVETFQAHTSYGKSLCHDYHPDEMVKNNEEAWYQRVLMTAARYHCDNLVKLVLAELDRTGLQLAVSVSHLDRKNEKGWTVLMAMSFSGNLEAVRTLLDRGASVDLQSAFGESALMLACQKGHCDIARLLVDRGAKLEVRNVFNWTPLVIARKHGHQPVVDMLLEAGASDIQIIEKLSKWRIKCLHL